MKVNAVTWGGVLLIIQVLSMEVAGQCAASNQTHYRALTDEKNKQARLRDCLATAELRLSVKPDTIIKE